MNDVNLDALDKLAAMAMSRTKGVDESFYYAILGNWSDIYAILKAHLARPEVGEMKRAMADGALHAWAMCEKARADAFKEAAEIVEEMSYPPEGQAEWHGTDNEWAAIKLEDAAKAIRERAAKTNHVTHALPQPQNGEG